MQEWEIIQVCGVRSLAGMVRKYAMRMAGDFCSSAVSSLWISNTWFPHKRIHKYTWECRGRGLRSLIDYFLVGKEARKQVIDVKAVRVAEIGSDHYLVLMKIKLNVRNVKKSTQERVRQQIKVGKLKDDKVRRKYQAAIAELFEEARARGRTLGTDVELVWKELKGGIVGAAMKVCGTTRKRRGETKRTRLWNEKVKCAVRKKKVLYRRLLDTGTEEAKQLYKEAKLETKKVVRNAKNEEWVQLGKELEKDAGGNQRRFWAKVNESRRLKAYDNVSREKLWKVLDEYGVKGKLLRAIQALYVDGKARVKVGGVESELFGVHRGVRQGCTSSPWLFNVFMDRVKREAKRQFQSEVKLSTGDVGVLLFADDMVVMAESVEGLQSNLQVLSDVLSRWELKVNWRKTKVMRVARNSEECEVEIREEIIEQVGAMKYLGVMISSDGSMDKEVEARIGNATRMIRGMNETVLRRKELSRSTKLKVVNATVMPKLMYGCETWSLSKRQQSKVQATQMNILRRIKGVSRLDRVRNVDVREKL